MDEQKKLILRQRAQELAKEPSLETAVEEGELYLVFNIGMEQYGVEATSVSEVYPLKRITPLPCTPSFILGIMNLRGRIISVLDVREMLGIQRASIPNSAKVVVIFTPDVEVAVIVDEVMGIKTFSSKDIASDSSLPQMQGIEYVSSVTRDRTILLDVRKLLAADRMIVNEEVT